MPTVSLFQPHEGRHLPAGRQGFDGPAFAEASAGRPLDLNEYCVRHPAATFFVRAGPEARREDGIREGDLLVVDRAIRPSAGATVLAVRGGEIRLERFRHPASEDEGETELWGVVTFIIRKS